MEKEIESKLLFLEHLENVKKSGDFNIKKIIPEVYLRNNKGLITRKFINDLKNRVQEEILLLEKLHDFISREESDIDVNFFGFFC